MIGRGRLSRLDAACPLRLAAAALPSPHAPSRATCSLVTGAARPAKPRPVLVVVVLARHYWC
jgi:hypothetical protein